MLSKKPLSAIGNLLQRWSHFKREMFLPKSKSQGGGGTLRREKCFEGIQFFSLDSDELLAVNQRFLAAVLEGSACFVVVPVEKTGKSDSTLPKICVHNKKITSIKWNPYDDHEISSASEDGTIKLWKIPDGGLVRDTSICQSLLAGHKKEVSILEWNPCAANVLLSIGLDMKCLIWNVRIESTFMEITMPGSEVASSVSWSPCGSSFVVLWKDQSLRVVEPRTGNSVLSTTLEHSRPGETKKVLFVDDKKLLTVASSATDIFIRLWTMDGSCLKLLKEETTHNSHNNISSSNNVNKDISFSSFLDSHQDTLYIFQKDNGFLRIYKLTPDDVINIASHVTSPHRGLAIMPTSGLNSSKHEVVRFYKVTSLRNNCEIISISGSTNKTVDASKHHVSQYSADEWFQGQPQSQLSPLTIKIKKPEYSSIKDQPTPTSSSSSSSPPPAPLPSLSPPPSLMSSSSFIHLTFSSPKMTRKLTKGVSADGEQSLLRVPDVIPRRNSAIGQQHYLYAASPSSTPSRFDTISSLPVGGPRGPPSVVDASTSFHNFSQPQLIQNRAYKGGGEFTRRGSGPPGAVPIYPLENGLQPGHLKAVPKRVSPRTRSHKSPTVSAVRLRRMKQKELMFQSSSSSSSEEGLDRVGKSDRWNENPLYSQTSHKSRKHPPRPRSKGRPESQRKHSLNPIPDRCSVIDFGPLDDALSQVINDHKSLSKSTCDISQVSRRNDLFRFQRIEPVDQTGSMHIPLRVFSGTRDKGVPDQRRLVNEFQHKNPILNGCLDAGHYRSAFSIVKPPANLPIHGHCRFPNSPAFDCRDEVRHLNYRNNFHSMDRLAHCDDRKSNFKLEFLHLRPSSQLLRAVSLKESPLDVPHLLNRSKLTSSNSFSAHRMQKINQSTPQLAGSPSVEHFHPLPSLQTSLQTIAEDDPRFQSVNDCFSSSSSSSSSLSSNTDCTLHSDHSTVNYELNNNYQRLSPDEDSQLSGPDEISNSFTYKGPLSNHVMRDVSLKSANEVAEKDIFEKCSRQKDEIEDLRKELNVKEEKIKVLEEQLKRISLCSDG